MNRPVNGKIHGLIKAFECFQVLFKANLLRTFQDSPIYSSAFQACANTASNQEKKMGGGEGRGGLNIILLHLTLSLLEATFAIC